MAIRRTSGRLRRAIRSVTWLPEGGRLELRLVLPKGENELAEERVDSVRARGGIRTPTEPMMADVGS
jgi:hypothetical protein